MTSLMAYIDGLDFTVLALTAASLAALMTSYLGVLVVLRRITFVGAALSQLAAAGVALSGLAEIPCTLGAVLMMVAGVGFFAQDCRRILPEDGLIGSSYAAAGAMAVLFIALAPHADSDMLGLMFGNILTAGSSDICMMAAVLLLIVILSTVFSKQFLLTAFDPMMAQAMGFNVKFWNWVFYLTIGTAIATAIHSAGALLVFSMLSVPPLTALCLSRRWNAVCLLSVLSALTAVFAGTYLSINFDLPAGASIVAVSCVLFLAALAGRRIVSSFSA